MHAHMQSKHIPMYLLGHGTVHIAVKIMPCIFLHTFMYAYIDACMHACTTKNLPCIFLATEQFAKSIISSTICNMYVCMYACMHLCMHTHIKVLSLLYIHVLRLSSRIHVYIHICLYICIYVCVCVFLDTMYISVQKVYSLRRLHMRVCVCMQLS